MSADYKQAVETLYRAPHESFVAARQRLAAELKGKGDKAQAARVAKLGRPTLSAWAVNQLWWQARADFERLFETAQQLRRGKHSASSEHREALAKLNARAKQLLKASEHATPDATLRRINMTLAGLAAAGDFEPELPGALTKDRDPPGFGAFGMVPDSEIDSEADRSEAEKPHKTKHEPPKHESKAPPHDAAERNRNEAAQAKEQREKERAAAEAARQREADRRRSARPSAVLRSWHCARPRPRSPNESTSASAPKKCYGPPSARSRRHSRLSTAPNESSPR